MDVAYHSLNRANVRRTLFDADGNYAAFERVLSEAQKHIRQSVVRGQPFGPIEWVGTMIDRFGLASTVRSEGRPKKLLMENGS